jgi:TolB-like protein/AraC-like DNA-binding protein
LFKIELSPKDQSFISKLTEIILENLEDESFGIKELAEKAAITQYNLRRKLHSITGKTISQFIRETRLNRAIELLRNEDVNVSEVAYKVGFSSPTYFNACFHEYFGFSPGSIKKESHEKAGERVSSDDLVKRGKGIRSSRTGIFVSLGFPIFAFLLYLLYYFVIKNPSQIDSSVKNPEKSVAVLPFKNLGINVEDQYFIDGVMEDILTNLSRIKALSVISRTSVEQFRETSMPVSQIRKKLKVEYVLEGSGQRYDNTFLLRVQLIQASKDKHIWAESYEQEIREPRDIFKIQSQVAQSIANELNARITPLEKELIEKTPTQSLTAHDMFLRAQYELYKYGLTSTNYEEIKRAEYFYHAALKYDSTYASAYLGLAAVYWKKMDLESQFPDNEDILNRYLDSVIILSEIAISHNEQLAEAYYQKGGAYLAKGDEIRALEDWDKAILYDPNRTNPYWGKGWF